MKTSLISRRNFLQKASATAGMAYLAPFENANNSLTEESNSGTLPREVWIAGLSQMGLKEKTPDLMSKRALEILKGVSPFKPDFICLPEVFPFSNVEQELTIAEKVSVSEKVLQQFAEFSKQNNCYTICPVYTARNGKNYNSAVVFNRAGNKIGSYDKIHLTEGEIEGGCTCGPLFQPVIKTEFGPIGVQICFDIEWDDGWTMLRRQGAEIIFWPSAFAGGKAVNTKAWQHKCVVASSTNKNTSKLCDITGELITQTGIWNQNLFCAPVNLEKAFLHIWPYVYRFKEIQNKYGRKIRITNFHEEEWSVIESLSPDIFVKDIMQEFELITHEQLMHQSETAQIKSRG